MSNRIVTNIVELSKLKRVPCNKYLKYFVDGKVDAHELFAKVGSEYAWLYRNSDYDLIAWEIENNCFDWDEYSWVVAYLCPQYFDPDKFNWRYDSWAVAKYCPQYFDPEKFNWGEIDMWVVAQYCPEKLSLEPQS